MFGKKKKQAVRPIPEGAEPVLRSSICTGETAAGFLMPENWCYVNAAMLPNVFLIRDVSDIDFFGNVAEISSS